VPATKKKKKKKREALPVFHMDPFFCVLAKQVGKKRGGERAPDKVTFVGRFPRKKEKKKKKRKKLDLEPESKKGKGEGDHLVNAPRGGGKKGQSSKPLIRPPLFRNAG